MNLPFAILGNGKYKHFKNLFYSEKKDKDSFTIEYIDPMGRMSGLSFTGKNLKEAEEIANEGLKDIPKKHLIYEVK